MSVITPQRTARCLAAALGIVTLALYLPALRHGFLWYDDQQYVTENPVVQAGLTRAGIQWAFGFHASNWHPVTWLSYMLDCQWFGLNPTGHHLTSVLLHVVNTMLLFWVLLRSTQSPWRSAIVAALFAWHPLHVESVAWIAERKDVLCAFFFILTLLVYTRYVAELNQQRRVPESGRAAARSRIAACYALVILSFALALMSKPMAVTLPFVLLLLDFWPLGRFANPEPDSERARLLETLPGTLSLRGNWWTLIEKVPLLLLSVGTCVLTVRAQGNAFSIVSTTSLPLQERVGHALVAYGHYLWSTFVPRALAAYYPYDRGPSALPLVIAAVALIAVTLFAIRMAGRRPYLGVGWCWYLGMLVPVIGLVQVGDQAWADRYTYLPLIGLSLALTWAGFDLAGRFPAARPIAASILAGMLVLTSIQLSYWKNTRTLFEHTARVTRNNSMAITVLGSELARAGRLEEAIERYKTALSYQPDLPEAHFFLGNALEQQGHLEEATREYESALHSAGLRAQVHVRLGVVFARQDRVADAIRHYTEALRWDPDLVLAHQNLARLLQTQGRLPEAIAHYQAALRLDPKLAPAHNNLGILLVQIGHPAEGIAQLREAARLNPGNMETEYNLALALNGQKRWAEAEPLLSKVVGSAVSDPNAQYQHGLALAHLRKTREAMSRYAAALLLRPDFPEALNDLAWLLAASPAAELRNGDEAVRLAERASDLTHRSDPAKLVTLAAAYAESGRFAEALATASNAQHLAEASGQSSLAAECARMAANFRNSQPWRGPLP